MKPTLQDSVDSYNLSRKIQEAIRALIKEEIDVPLFTLIGYCYNIPAAAQFLNGPEIGSIEHNHRKRMIRLMISNVLRNYIETGIK